MIFLKPREGWRVFSGEVGVIVLKLRSAIEHH